MTSSADIRLRALEPEDLDVAYRIENDPELNFFGTASVPYSRYTLKQYIASTQNDFFADGQVRFVIEYDGNAVGFADLTNFDAIHQRAEIGLAILPDFQGLHLGEAVVELLCDYARRMHLHQLYAIIATTNKPASRLFERLAFQATTVLKDWISSEGEFVDAVVWQMILN